MNKFKKAVRFILKVRKHLKNKYFRAGLRYLHYYKTLKIDEHLIMLEAQGGKTVNGNIFYILKELAQNENYKNYTVKVIMKESKCDFAKHFLNSNGITGFEVVPLAGKEYYRILASAKYLITDTSISQRYIKKDGQVLINTWHGTPLKTLGKKVKNEPHTIGNVQKNFIQADFLLYPSEFMKEHMIEDYMLENISSAKVLLSGYPRNTAFFDTDSRRKIREDMDIDNKQVIMYMPTWRGAVGKVNVEISTVYTTYFLLEIDKKLNDEQILFVNLHPFVGDSIKYNFFKHIKQFPDCYETYEFLNAADCLITDYSSVFIDFAITKKKIILFTYDEKEYLADRGMYLNISELPFPSVKNVDQLIDEINSPIQYDDKEFLSKFCSYESKNAAKDFCERTILGQKNSIHEEEIPHNGKENVLLYVGNLSKNGITASVKNLLQAVDLEQYNYYITFRTKNVQQNKDVLFEFPDKVNYLAMPGGRNGSLKNKIMNTLFMGGFMKANMYIKHEKENLQYDIKRIYGNTRFSTVIQFNGYEKANILLFSLFDANTVIYVHSDMQSEVTIKGNQRRDVLEYAYSHYDKVAIVTKDMSESAMSFADSAERLYVANNIIHYKEVLKKSELDVAWDPETESNVPFDRLLEVLNDKSLKKFITIGRFSKEKGHERLLHVFSEFNAKHPDTFLIIIGGYGKNYDAVKALLASLPCANRVILIKSVSNPYSILKKCDYFVLSSFYEAFGLVLAEADILKKPLICTDIPGPRGFMTENNGKLVENNEKGLYNGLELLYENKIDLMNVDYEQYNQNAINQFLGLLK